MQVIEDLETEHNAIKLMLKILDEISKDFETQKDIPEDHLDGVVEFFTIFADKCHHGKEENLLFPKLIEKGVSLEDEPFATILSDHQVGKNYITNMLEAITTYKQDQTGGKKFATNARKYQQLLTQHIDLENTKLFDITNQYLSSEEQKQLKQEFDEFELNVIGEGTHDRLHQSIDQLKAYYL